MSVATFNTSDVLLVDAACIEELKRRALTAPKRRYRLCMHRSHQDAVQEMVIAFCRDSRVEPHRHLSSSESFHVIEGEVRVILYDDQGSVVRTLELGAPGSGKPFLYRLSSPAWHTVEPLTEFVVFHETAAGPFVGQTEPPPPWAR